MKKAANSKAKLDDVESKLRGVMSRMDELSQYMLEPGLGELDKSKLVTEYDDLRRDLEILKSNREIIILEYSARKALVKRMGVQLKAQQSTDLLDYSQEGIERGFSHIEKAVSSFLKAVEYQNQAIVNLSFECEGKLELSKKGHSDSFGNLVLVAAISELVNSFERLGYVIPFSQLLAGDIGEISTLNTLIEQHRKVISQLVGDAG